MEDVLVRVALHRQDRLDAEDRAALRRQLSDRLHPGAQPPGHDLALHDSISTRFPLDVDPFPSHPRAQELDEAPALVQIAAGAPELLADGAVLRAVQIRHVLSHLPKRT